ncbi:MAG: hypothetical protein JXB88_13415, partial [Spirochaetales bacterium]|nr:hypothetical protein [Spirochaetales bacterium]
EGADREKDMPVAVLKGQNQDGRAEVKWRYHYIHNPNNPLKEKPKFVFTAKSFRCEEVESGGVEWGADTTILCRDSTGDILAELNYYLLKDGKKDKQGKTDNDGILKETDIIPGQYILFDFNDYKKKESNKKKTSEIIKNLEKYTLFTMKNITFRDGVSIDPSYTTEIIISTLALRLAIDPAQRDNKDDTYTLYSNDPEKYYKCSQTVKDDKIEGDNYLDLHFVGIRSDVPFSLEVDMGKEGGAYHIFEKLFF